jgi:hypothetical protein
MNLQLIGLIMISALVLSVATIVVVGCADNDDPYTPPSTNTTGSTTTGGSTTTTGGSTSTYTGGTMSTTSTTTGGSSMNPGDIYINAFVCDYDSASAQGGTAWLDITIPDISKLSGNWKVLVGTYFHRNEIMNANDISTFTLANGDVIRIHGDDGHYTGGHDTSSKTEDGTNTDKWDYVTTSSYHLNYKYGAAWIETEEGNVINIVAYTTDNNTDNKWVEDDFGSDEGPYEKLAEAVNAGLWNGENIADAFDHGATDTGYATLSNTSSPGTSASAWTVQN